MKAQSIISAPLIANYILKLKVKKIYGKMLVVLKCHLRWNLSSKVNQKNPATDSSHLGQWLRWPEPHCGRHQQGWHHLARHGKSTQNAFYTTSKWVVSILLRNCETLCRKKYLNLILNLFESCHCELFVLVQEGGPHTEKNLGWPTMRWKSQRIALHRTASCSKFSQSKN